MSEVVPLRPDRKEAKKLGLRRYYGKKLCARHQAAGGERYVISKTCVLCAQDRSNKWRWENPGYWQTPERIEKRKGYTAQWKTGIGEALFAKLWALQGGKCGVCAGELSPKKAMRDHCHQTGHPRGLLCNGCNVAEGVIRKRGGDPMAYAQRLLDYLANPPASKIHEDAA